MSFLDKTFCASPNCKNDCGRRMTDAERERLTYSQAQYVSYGYFCGEDEEVKRLKAVRIPKETCLHEFKKTLDKSGMFFIELCHKCMETKSNLP